MFIFQINALKIKNKKLLSAKNPEKSSICFTFV